ncbi:MAG: septum formation protein Maf [Candidatus Heimdallarchaeota archaeon]|nr:septum formation protein Maf [Candidatus Heimdallarchaeota archaeon]
MVSNPILILASKSPARAAVLSQLNIPFIIIPSEIDEIISELDPRQFVLNLSEKKAERVVEVASKRYDAFIVIGCDTVVMDPFQTIIGKPKNRQDASNMLYSLSGNIHTVLTGFTIINYPTMQIKQKIVSTLVKFRNLTTNEINFYLEKGEWWNKAGSYAIQGLGAILVEEIIGDYYNVIGFPLTFFWEVLVEQLGIPWILENQTS